MIETHASPTLPHHAFIISRLPDWLLNASPEQRRELHRLALAADAARQALRQAQESLPSLRQYALALLRSEFASELSTGIDPERAVLHWVDPAGQRSPSQRSLLEAALLNFHASEAVEAAYAPGSGLFARALATGEPDVAQPLPLTPAAFARRCRELDIGGRYRLQLLEQIPASLPSRAVPVDADPPLCWRVFDAQRKAFMLEAHTALMKGQLRSAGRALLAGWSFVSGPARPAQACRLELLGFPLAGPLVFQPLDDDQIGPVVAYFPGDLPAPVAEYANAQALALALGQKLRDPAQVKRFATFVPAARRLEFVERLNDSLKGSHWLAPHLRWTPVPLAGDPFVDCYRVWAQQSLAQAARAAVPTDMLDRRDTLDRYAHWVALGEQLGLTLAMLVGSAIPGVNLIVDGIMLTQGVYSIYEGMQAWRAGDSQAALDYLFGAVENATFLGLGKRPEPSPETRLFAERLLPVVSADGQVRLWRPEPEDYQALEEPPAHVRADEAGRYRHRGRAWVKIEGRFHEVEHDASARHARLIGHRQVGFAPAVQGNGRGGWRLAHEDPLRWSGAGLLRRFDPAYEALPDSVMLQAQRLSGISDGQLRQAHLDHQPAPAPLAHLLRRRMLERRVDAIVGALRSHRRLATLEPRFVELLTTAPGWPTDRALVYEYQGTDHRFGSTEDAQPVRLSDQLVEDGSWAQHLLSDLGSVATEGLLGENTSLVPAEPVRQMLGQHWAKAMEEVRDQLIDLWLLESTGTGSARETLRRHFPGLVDEALDALLVGLTAAQHQMLTEGRVPLPIAELAAESLRQLRLTRACDALAQGRFSPDRERLVFGLWPHLAEGTAAMRIELREGHFAGPLLNSTGSSDLPHWVIVRQGRAYQALDAQGLELSPVGSLEQALFATVPDAYRAGFQARVRDVDGLRHRLVELALADREALRLQLGMIPDRRPFFRPPSHQANGAVGYELSGRGRSLETPLGAISPILAALRGLYPDVSQVELLEIRTSLGDGEAATTALARLNADLARLRLDLDTWVNRALDSASEQADIEREHRSAIAREITRAWQRRESTYAMGWPGYGLNLRNWPVSELPTLSVRLDHVHRLALVNLHLSEVSDAFLASFPNVQWLDLSFNELTRLPSNIGQFSQLRRLTLDATGRSAMSEILDAVAPVASGLEHLEAAGNSLSLTVEDIQRLGQLPRLRTLALDYNLITLDEATASAFNQLTALEELNLSGNPLQRAPQLSQMQGLVRLDMSSAGIAEFPPGLIDLMNREPPRILEIDLSSNSLTHLPDLSETRFVHVARQALDDIESPYYGSGINLDGNPLDEESRVMLRQASVEFFTDPSSDDEGLGAHPDEWLTGCPEALAASIRAERTEQEAAEFYGLLSRIVHTADYRTDPVATRRRAWTLVQTWLQVGTDSPPGLSQLRERLFSLAQDTQGTCGDGVALTLDDMEFEVEAWRRMIDAQGGGEAPMRALLDYQRGLWRRALVDEIARAIVRGRIARHTALANGLPPPSLHAMDDISDAVLEQGLDEVEVRFRLFQLLEGGLSLPPSRGMQYNARVSGNTAHRVGAEVLQRDTDEAFAHWVARQPGFRLYLERAYSAEFEPEQERWQTAADALYNGAQPDASRQIPAALEGLREALPELNWDSQRLPALTDQQTRVAYDWVSRRREESLDALALRLTRQLLGLDQARPATPET